MKQLPDKETTLNVMVITHLLSKKSTDSLGYFDIQYLYEPHAVKAVKRYMNFSHCSGKEQMYEKVHTM